MRERWKAVLGGRELARFTALPNVETELPVLRSDAVVGLVGACAVGIGLKGFRQGREGGQLRCDPSPRSPRSTLTLVLIGGAACYGPLVVSSSHNACPEILFRNGIIGHRELVRSGISYSPLDNNVK